MGHAPVLAPCLAISLLPARLPAQIGALVITSGQAVPALPDSLHHVPVFCVGDATGEKLRLAGFCRVESASGDAEKLFRLITARRLPGLHVLAVGERHGIQLARQFREAGISVLRRKVYAAKPLRALPAPAEAALAAGEIAAALFYSAESARAFARLNPPETAHVTAYALSEAAARPLHGLPWRAIRVAVAPTEADILALIP